GRGSPQAAGGESSAGATGARGAALERAALVLGHAAPDTGVLAGLHGPLEAAVHDVAAPADGLGLIDLQQRRPGVPDREEQLRVLVEARGAVAPVHQVSLARVRTGHGGPARSERG